MMPVGKFCKCSARVPLSVKTENYRIRANPTGCHLRKYAKLFSLDIRAYIPIESQFYWNNCACNEFDALTRRHLLGNIPGYDPGNPHLKSLETNLMELTKSMKQFTSVSHKILMDNTRTTMKKRYKRAHFLLRSRVVNISEKESRCKTFVKYEKIPIGKFESSKPPRLIQFRDFTYVYSLKRHVLGHSLMIKSDPTITWFYQQKANTVFTKLYDSYGIARVMRESWDHFSSPVAVCLDHSKFDGHYCSEILSLEHKYWMTLNGEESLKRLLKMQFLNKGITSCGIKYKVSGTRLSGEYTTSEGNSVMNYLMLITWLKVSSITNARVHVNGDDSVIMIEHKDLAKLKPLEYFRNFNMETEQDRVAYDFRNISYCQAQPIRVEKDGSLVWYMVKEPARSLSRIMYSDIRYMRIYERYLTGVGLCELAVSSGVPITQALALRLASLSNRPLGSVDKYPAKHSGNLSEVKRICMQTRVDYEYAFGIPVSTQIMLEDRIAGCLRSTQDRNLNRNLEKFKYFSQR
nr:RNA-dependent RNA polymerase [Tolivirales sp.]